MNKNIIFLLICLGIMVGLVVGIVLPKCQEYQKLAQDIKKNESDKEYYQSRFDQVEEANSKLAEYKDSLSKIEAGLLADFSYLIFCLNLEKICSQSEVVLDNIGESPSKAKGKIIEHHFNISVSGSYSNFQKFLSNLAKSSGLIEVESISFSYPEFSKEEVSEMEKILSFSLGIKTYSY